MNIYNSVKSFRQTLTFGEVFSQYEQQHVEGITKGFSFLATQNTLNKILFSVGNVVLECCFFNGSNLSKVMLPNISPNTE